VSETYQVDIRRMARDGAQCAIGPGPWEPWSQGDLDLDYATRAAREAAEVYVHVRITKTTTKEIPWRE
jgi:hypothetical protein